MGSAAGARNDGLQTPFARGGRVFEQQVRRAVGRYHANLMRDAERIQDVGGTLHRFPVGRRSHNDSDQGLHEASLAIYPNNWRRNAKSSRAPTGERCSKRSFSAFSSNLLRIAWSAWGYS